MVKPTSAAAATAISANRGGMAGTGRPSKSDRRSSVLVGEAVPVPAQAQHADAHLLSTAHGRGVHRDGSLGHAPAHLPQLALLCGRKPRLQQHQAVRQRHLHVFTGLSEEPLRFLTVRAPGCSVARRGPAPLLP